ncbi:hypothetical protein C3L33_17008, partial [Rhododendron williamsianum]
MEITRKRRNLDANTNGDLDLISNLPRHIIDCVLNRLPFHDVVRTSVLSRKWRGYWTTLQHLDLGYEFYLFVKDAMKNKSYSTFDRYRQYDKNNQYEYERIISRIFFFQLGPLVKVTLYIPKFIADDRPVYPVPDTEQWILHLSRKNIKELTLTYKNREHHLLPSCFFLCLNLTHLELSNIVLVPPPDFKGFRNLIAIQCSGVKFNANMFESLMHGSPLLQKLVFVDCSGMDHFKVSAPIWKSYVSKTTQFLAGDTLPQQLTTTVEGLKYLKLNSLDFANFDEVYCALCLIRSAPNLKQLEIQACTTREDILAPKWGYMEAEAPFGCTLDGLRVVKMNSSGVSSLS